MFLAKRTNSKIFRLQLEVYGTEISPQSESYTGKVNTLGPRACYEGKRAKLFFDYHRQHKLDIRIKNI